MKAEFICRAMQVHDLADVIRIQAEAYVDEILETDEVIYARFAQAPDTSWVVERGGKVCGYLVGYQSALGEISPWGGNFMHKPEPTAIYLHDLAISRSAAGYGLGPLLVNHVLMEARQRKLLAAALVSVQNSKSFWKKLGFNEYAQLDQIQERNLASYSGPAIYMTRNLTA